MQTHKVEDLGEIMGRAQRAPRQMCGVLRGIADYRAVQRAVQEGHCPEWLERAIMPAIPYPLAGLPTAHAVAAALTDPQVRQQFVADALAARPDIVASFAAPTPKGVIDRRSPLRLSATQVERLEALATASPLPVLPKRLPPRRDDEYARRDARVEHGRACYDARERHQALREGVARLTERPVVLRALAEQANSIRSAPPKGLPEDYDREHMWVLVAVAESPLCPTDVREALAEHPHHLVRAAVAGAQTPTTGGGRSMRRPCYKWYCAFDAPPLSAEALARLANDKIAMVRLAVAMRGDTEVEAREGDGTLLRAVLRRDAGLISTMPTWWRGTLPSWLTATAA